MLYFEFPESSSSPVIFTGDLLCPLLRKQDYAILRNAQNLFIDSNNRFPYPESNHISFSGRLPESDASSPRLLKWLSTHTIDDLIQPHLQDHLSDAEQAYWKQFKLDHDTIQSLPHTICDFLHTIPIPRVYMVHYFGLFDRQLYGQELLSQHQLEAWAASTASENGLKGIRFRTPKPGERIRL